MSSLTIEKMDKINFLITEVSLECLGNKYFDIYGNQSDSLLRLISANSLKPGAIDEDKESDLWTSLTATEVTKTNKVKSVNRRQAAAAARAAAAEAVANVNKKPLKRRASFSIANETDAANEPESLLVPMAPKAAKISNRRSTISVQLAKSRNRTIPIAINSIPIPMPTRIRRSIPVPEAVPLNSKSVAEIKQDLLRNTDARKSQFVLSFKANTYILLMKTLSLTSFQSFSI